MVSASRNAAIKKHTPVTLIYYMDSQALRVTQVVPLDQEPRTVLIAAGWSYNAWGAVTPIINLAQSVVFMRGQLKHNRASTCSPHVTRVKAAKEILTVSRSVVIKRPTAVILIS